MRVLVTGRRRCSLLAGSPSPGPATPETPQFRPPPEGRPAAGAKAAKSRRILRAGEKFAVRCDHSQWRAFESAQGQHLSRFGGRVLAKLRTPGRRLAAQGSAGRFAADPGQVPLFPSPHYTFAKLRDAGGRRVTGIWMQSGPTPESNLVCYDHRRLKHYGGTRPTSRLESAVAPCAC